MRLVGRNRVVPAFAKLKQSVPELTDAFTSPGGDMTVVITNDKLLVFSVADEKLTKLLETEFPSGATPVMEQWALGTHADSWTQQVRQWKVHAPPVAVISEKQN
jgi:hypothetical protein